jgi:predicted ATPase/class 3 adenylate cyclase
MPLSARPDLPTGTATFLFTDIQGSTPLVQKLGIERWKVILDTHYEILREHFQAHDGREVNTEGDAFFVAFPQANQAVAACAAGQRAMYRHDWPEDAVIRVRMGLHTGEAAMVGGDYMGLDIHRAARIASAAHGGQVVLSDTTRALVEASLPQGVDLIDLGQHRLKDLARPERIWQLRMDGLPFEFPALKSLDLTLNNLPTQLTSFVGRDKELATGLQLLASSRLLTLTGPGGTGKTRLSLQIAAEASDDFKHGVFFVPLAPITDPDLVPSAILQVLGLHDAGGRPPQDMLLDYLRDREALLVLDNFEQLLAAAGYVGEMLKSSPGSKIISTSRAALRVYGEQEFPVPPLGVPDSSVALTLDSMSQYEAVKLFIERAVSVKPDFAVTNENAPAVAAITELVDGLPLAIELAAARVKLLAPQAMLDRLQNRLGELGGGARDLPERQQTLRGAIAWSYDLLDPGSQELFARFAVFVRGGSLAQVEEICGPPDELGIDILDGLGTLVDHNLLRPAEQQDEPRFFMLHVIREFALERLAEAGDATEVHRRHAETFIALAETAAPHLTGPEQKAWLDKLDLEHDNLRGALTWAIEEKDGPLASRLLAACWRFWQMRGYLSEAGQRAADVLKLPDLAARERYAALEASGGIAYWRGDQAAAGGLYREALEIARTLDDPPTLAAALYNAAFPDLITADNVPRAQKLLEDALATYRHLDDEAGVAKTLWAMAELSYVEEPRDWATAIALLLEARPVFERLRDNFGLGWALYVLGGCYTATGQFDSADEVMREALVLFSDADDKSGVSLLLNGFALLALAQGDPARAAKLEGARTAIESASGVGLLRSRQPWMPDLQQMAELLPDTQPKAFSEGQETPTEKAIALALQTGSSTAV